MVAVMVAVVLAIVIAVLPLCGLILIGIIIPYVHTNPLPPGYHRPRRHATLVASPDAARRRKDAVVEPERRMGGQDQGRR